MDKPKRKSFSPATYWFVALCSIIGVCFLIWKGDILDWSGLSHLDGAISIAFWSLYAVTFCGLAWVAHSRTKSN